MGRGSVFLTAVFAAATSGALCALGYLLVLYGAGLLQGDETDPLSGLAFTLAVWATLGVYAGVVAGVLLGIVPTVLAVVFWPSLQSRVGPARGAAVTSAVVTVIAGVEMLGALRFLDGIAAAEALAWSVGAALVAGGVAWLLLSLVGVLGQSRARAGDGAHV